ncbi:MAG: UDP-N-acetylmuramate dehydrogenase, partial [Burkholderiales bacterium]|nr:UDP-N-acetylmuramate dehydrogenase [Burkholderiales bacterium]
MAEPVHFDAFPQPLRGRWLDAEPMRRHTSWRAGGAADRAYVPADLDDLRALLVGTPRDVPLLPVGLGSNLLVRDAGLPGIAVLLHAALGRVELQSDGLLFTQCGVASPKVSRFAAVHGFEGAEFLAGIPGTVGGAVAMNAGCYGTETWDRVARVLTLDRTGRLRERVPAHYVIGYRHCVLRDDAPDRDAVAGPEWFVAVWWRFDAGDGDAARARIRSFLARRIATQPLGQPNAGSVFRNPPGDHAARLIEACGLKGHTTGGAQVS